ncbi:MAG: low temperature requirement protein A [Hamadaea sp.]|nr:low temperature requirement protein A [Hamadaea sp.]NUR49571.1 low temperature requirement protein A [Hamadaea sp.]NUT06203.1 low temperature requirement protein A [Hamadaea sp.]
MTSNATPLRERTREQDRVTFTELFFDLVYVFAVTQLSHLLLSNLSWTGALQTAMLLVAVWWAWQYTTWFTNFFHPDHRQVRVVLFAVMLAGLVMAAMLPYAFGDHGADRGLAFAVAYAVIQVGRTGAAVFFFRGMPVQYANFLRILFWNALAASAWIAGGFAHGTARYAFWLAAIVLDLAGPPSLFPTPILGRSRTAEWDISGTHFAERCQLFLIIALGESILVTGATFSSLPFTWDRLLALVTAFLGAVAFWWVYFDRNAELGSDVIAHSTDPGALGRNAFTYFHLPIVAGVIVSAVGDELVIAHPLGHSSWPAIATVLGGAALFLAGHALYKWALSRKLSRGRLIACAALLAVMPVAPHLPPIVLAGLAAVVVAAVAVRDKRR